MNLIENHNKDIQKLCKAYKVKSLYAFGSVLTDAFNSESDVDLIVDFDTNCSTVRFLFRKTDLSKVEDIINSIHKFKKRKQKQKPYDYKFPHLHVLFYW